MGGRWDEIRLFLAATVGGGVQWDGWFCKQNCSFIKAHSYFKCLSRSHILFKRLKGGEKEYPEKVISP